MKKFSEKIIATTITLSLILSLGLNILFLEPKTAKATDLGAGWANNIKEMVLDSVGWVVSDVMMKRLEKNIMDWGMGKKSKIQLPFGIEDFKDYFDEFLNVASGKFINELKMTKLCEGINVAIGSAPQINLRTLRSNLRSVGRFSRMFNTYAVNRPTYPEDAKCTLEKAVNNIEAFIKRPRISIFGWDAWKALNYPQNNIFGAFFSALDRKTQIAAREVMNAAQQASAGGGYRNQTATTANSKDKCTQDCQAGTNLPACIGDVQTICAQRYPNVGPIPINEGDAELYQLYQQCLEELGDVSEDCQTQIQSCINNCQRIPFVPLSTAVTNLGSHIQTSVNKSLGADMEKIIGTDEITELIGIFFSAVLNKAMTGLGLAFRSNRASATQQSRATNQDRFAYQKQFLKNTSSTEKKDIRSSIYSTLEQSIRQFSRSIIACKDDEMMTYQDYGKNLADMLEANVEALYVGIQGVNLQPDSVVLDPPYAPYTVYGYSWGEVFPSKVPQKCRTILNQVNMASNTTCSNIISGLEPNYQMTAVSTSRPQCNDGLDNDSDGLIDYPNDSGCYSLLDNSEISVSGGGGVLDPEEHQRGEYVLDLVPGIGEVPCIPCLYDHDALNCPVGPVPPQRYPGEGNTVWTSAMLNNKQNFYQSCSNQYIVALNRCDECLKKYDEACAKLGTGAERINCITQNCDNYYDELDADNNPIGGIMDIVIDPPTSPLDFYGKCLIEEQKDACLTCLKEYYVPATYCEQVRDYAARLVIKYPTVVVNKHAKNEGEFRGLFDQSISDMGGLCNDNDHAEDISLALICRAIPDFAHNGQKVCQTRCMGQGMTAQQLQDVTDFRPDENDCGRVKLDVGGQEPFDTIDEGILESRGRCCSDFWQDNRRNYTICVGSGPTTETTGPGETTILRVTLSASPASGLAPLNNVDLTARVTGTTEGQILTYNFDCDNNGTFEFSSPETQQTTYTATDVCNYPLNNTTYTSVVYVISAFGSSTSSQVNVQTTDCGISAILNPASGIPPVSVDITATLNNSDAGPFTYVFYCNVPLTGGTIDTWGGATIEYTENTNPFTLANVCNFTTSGTKGIGVSIETGSGTRSCFQTISVQETPSISCDAEVIGPAMPSINDPIDIFVQTAPNSSYIDLIHNAVGTTYGYDCHGGTAFAGTRTSTNTSYQSSPCAYAVPGIYDINVRVGNTNPANGFTAYNTCRTSVTVGSGGFIVP